MGQRTVPQVREQHGVMAEGWGPLAAGPGQGWVGEGKHIPSDSVSPVAGGWWSGWRP